MSEYPCEILEGMGYAYDLFWARNGLVPPDVRKSESGICVIGLISEWRFHFIAEGDNFGMRARQRFGKERLFTLVRGDVDQLTRILDELYV